jgi:hypothetical protein
MRWLRRSTWWIFDTAGGTQPAPLSSPWMRRAPQRGCSRRMRQISASTSASIWPGDTFGRRERSSTVRCPPRDSAADTGNTSRARSGSGGRSPPPTRPTASASNKASSRNSAMVTVLRGMRSPALRLRPGSGLTRAVSRISPERHTSLRNVTHESGTIWRARRSGGSGTCERGDPVESGELVRVQDGVEAGDAPVLDGQAHGGVDLPADVEPDGG